MNPKAPFSYNSFELPWKFSHKSCYVIYVLDSQEKVKDRISWAFQRDSELVECFNHNLLKMVEAGIFHQLHSTFVDIGRGDELNANGSDDATPMGYMNVAFPSLLLLVGLTLALLQLAAECVWERTKKYLCN